MSATPDSILSDTATVDEKAVEAIPNSKQYLCANLSGLDCWSCGIQRDERSPASRRIACRGSIEDAGVGGGRLPRIS